MPRRIPRKLKQWIAPQTAGIFALVVALLLQYDVWYPPLMHRVYGPSLTYGETQAVLNTRRGGMPQVEPGGPLLTRVVRCNRLDHVLRIHVTRTVSEIDGTRLYSPGDADLDVEPGCQDFERESHDVIPADIAPGVYVVHGSVTYRDWYGDERAEYRTEPFRVLRVVP